MYFKILELFILKILFAKGEYNITSKNFNPIKILTISFLVCNVFFNIFLLSKLSGLYIRVTNHCPDILYTNLKDGDITIKDKLNYFIRGKPHIDIDDLMKFINNKNTEGTINVSDLEKYIHREETEKDSEVSSEKK